MLASSDPIKIRWLVNNYGREHVTRCMAAWFRTSVTYGESPEESGDVAAATISSWLREDIHVWADHPLVTLCRNRSNLER